MHRFAGIIGSYLDYGCITFEQFGEIVDGYDSAVHVPVLKA
jgi:hypothetical protein